jgi:hypothetical protein
VMGLNGLLLIRAQRNHTSRGQFAHLCTKRLDLVNAALRLSAVKHAW